MTSKDSALAAERSTPVSNLPSLHKVDSALDTHRSTAIIVGVLFIIATVFLFIGEAFYGPILESTDYLVKAYPDRQTAVFGIRLEFSCIIAIPLIPVFLFPLLRKYNEALAIADLGMTIPN